MKTDLVIQGPTVSHALADLLSRRIGGNGVEQIGPSAMRILDVPSIDGVAAYCMNAELDFALVPAHRRLADFRLVAMDMDSTLITIECIDELADLVGRKAEVSAITAAAMRGELDYPASLRQRVAVLAGIELAAIATVYTNRLRLSPGAEPMLMRLRALGIKTLLVSGGFTYFTDRLKDRLNLDFAHSNTLEIAEGKLTGRLVGDIVDGAGKAQAVVNLAKRLAFTTEQIIVIGDGANDLPMMAAAGVSIAYRAKPAVRAKATYCFNHTGLDGLLNLFR